ncbi:MAG: altronate dehydratase family protein [Defluviitaleaceae bacterium]|nr:altronate dehydratase family protein [Defluviitaleaceae bacterium]
MKLLKIHPADNVAVALAAISAGEELNLGELSVTAAQDITPGHKVALNAIESGANVVKYGHPIGHATAPIAAGCAVHTHNLATSLSGLLEYEYAPNSTHPAPREAESFQGYRRPDGKVGIRNEVWIVPTVGCINSTAAALERAGQELVRAGIDGLYAFPHPYGCSQLSDDLENTRRAIAGLVRHPNAGAVLVLGLGCENLSITMLQEMLGQYDTRRVKFLSLQDSADEFAEGMDALRELTDYAAAFTRESVPMSELVVGLKCGGSDGFSGITANPLVGAFADRLVAEGGSVILTEVPEMFGAETILMNRCRTPELFERTVSLINDFKSYYISNGQDIYENPSPGNKAGGISTLEDKSLGCIQKGGNSDIADVLGYCEPVTRRGLNLLSGPGNDLVSVSNMTASGAHLVLFTTGRGTPFGAPAPTLKISSNTALYDRKRNWIDFDAGRLLSGTPMDTLRDELYAHIRDLASGKLQARNETVGAREFTIFKTGVTL